MNIAEPVGQINSAARLVVRCLGRFRLEDQHGNQLQLRTRKARAVLAALALNGRPMSRDALADLLWSDRGEVQARSSLRQTIFELQHFEAGASPILIAGRDDLSARRNHLVTDIELLRGAASDADWPRLLALLADCEPGLLTDLDGLDQEYDDWLRHQRAQEPARTLTTAVAAAERCMAEAGPRVALDLVSEILRLDPVNEEATRLGLRIDHALGDSRALHRRFEQLRSRLQDEFGAEPSPETGALFAKLANGKGPVSTTEASEPIATPPAKPQPRVSTLALSLVLVAALGALVALIWFDRTGSPTATGPVVIAVLPFEQLPREDGFIAAGLWEHTRAALTRNGAIQVLGRATTSAVVAEKAPPADYLKRFGVTHLLEGSVKLDGPNVLVSVSLSRTADGVGIWQGMFRGRMNEPFGLQDAIASGIEGKLRARLAPGGGRRAYQIATSPEVYALYSEARQLISTRERAGFARAEALLRQAVKKDPNYAPSWSLLGAAIFFNGRIAIVDADARAEGLAAVRRALELAPNFAPAHATLALLKGDNSPEAEAGLRRAVALDPNYSEAWNWLGNSLSSQGRYRDAMASYERAVALDPLLSPAVANLSLTARELNDQAAVDRVQQRVSRAGASAELLFALQADDAQAQGDYSSALKLLSQHGVDESGRPKRLLWESWFNSLTGIGHYDILHGITACPDWYAPLVSGKALPPTSFEGKPVTPEEFWTSMFFSTPASRAMVKFGRSRDLLSLYRDGFQNADEFVSVTGQRNMLPELAANLAFALRAHGRDEEARYLLASASRRLEQVLERTPSRTASGRLALVRAAQGEDAQAVALLAAAQRKGWLPDGRTITLDLAEEPAFQSLKGDPGFEAVRKRILDHLARERAELGPLKV